MTDYNFTRRLEPPTSEAGPDPEGPSTPVGRLTRPLSEGWSKVIFRILFTLIIGGMVLMLLRLDSRRPFWIDFVGIVLAITCVGVAVQTVVEMSLQIKYRALLLRQGWPRVWGLDYMPYLNKEGVRQLPPYDEVAILPASSIREQILDMSMWYMPDVQHLAVNSHPRPRHLLHAALLLRMALKQERAEGELEQRLRGRVS